MTHPARYSPEVLAACRPHLPAGTRIHDPFAGTGERLGQLADELGLYFTGTELEAGFIVSPCVRQGDATDPATYPPRLLCLACDTPSGAPQYVPMHTGNVGDDRVTCPCYNHHPRGYVVVTSPVYPNGMADAWNAQDRSRRRTYQHALGSELHRRNMGRYGYRHGGFASPAWHAYWHLARETVACWHEAERAIVNVSDFVAGGQRVPVVRPWRTLLEQAGWSTAVELVGTQRWRDGANADARVEAEALIICTR